MDNKISFIDFGSISEKNKIFNVIKIIILSLLFYGAIAFENAKGERLYTLVIIFIIYLLLGVIRRMFKDKRLFFQYMYIFDIGLIYLLEHYSRFQINYFFHSFYIVLLLEISFNLNRKSSLIIGISAVIVSLLKYIMLVYYIPNLVNMSQMAFFTLISTFVLIITAFAQYHREEKNKKDLLYKELLDTHKRLKEYSNEIEKLTIIEERNRIARDIHDTLGHSMTGIIMEIEMADHLLDNNVGKSKELLKEAKKSAREGLIRIREVVETLTPEKEITNGIESIKELADEFSKKTGAKIDLQIKGVVFHTNPNVNLVIYRTIQEALTNSIRHGKSTEIIIELYYNNDKINFTISDNGLGCNDIHEGFGLKGMRERVASLNGNIEIYSNGNFTISGYIPVRRENND
ncbi:sensor histidine kinase [Sporosalibacterium faouarense]|uniref:sensor histidine kinase n=1 Tax=Sporosalibacterium faouarense TaxID=516123 RepID=UPI00192C600D|nr:sensor histidine kinase [Sporosalibacterium faouarense]